MAKKEKATTLYKLTDENDRTYGGCQWGENVTHTASGKGNLCSSAWLHAYTHPVLAHMLNPLHGNFAKPHLWVCKGIVGTTDNGLKVGCTSLTTVHRLDITPPTVVNRIAFAIGCAYNVYYHNPSWVAWARAWVVESKRDANAAYAARAAAYAAYRAAAAYAADPAARAAYAAARAATAAYAADRAAVAYTAVAYAAAAHAALPLGAIADWAVTVK